MRSPTERDNLRSEEFSAFLASFFDLLSATSPAKLRRYANMARSLNPDLQSAITALAAFSEEHLVKEAHSRKILPGGLLDGSDSPEPNAFLVQVGELFRDETLFPRNEDLMAFLGRRFGMKFGTSSYSRTSILKRFARRALILTAKEQADLLDYLKTTNVQNGLAPKEHSFLRAWTEAISKS